MKLLGKLIHLFYVPYVKWRYILLRKQCSLIKVVGSEETIEYILHNHSSVSRYGDGELDMIFCWLSNNKYKLNKTFQSYDKVLAQRLYEILSAEKNDERHIVCIPYWFKEGIELYKPQTQHFCRKYLYKNINKILSCINLNRTYYNANITRFYISRSEKKHCREYVVLLKKIWEGRNVCFVEGEKSRLGVGNDLFSNTSSITRILCPATNAFSRYEEILQTIQKLVPHETLLLIALGHTATVLAYDLSKKGYQAIDIGHVDIEYEWMRMRAQDKVPIRGKFVNEVGKNNLCLDCIDSDYHKQIIARI